MDAQRDGQAVFDGSASGVSATACARDASHDASLCHREDERGGAEILDEIFIRTFDLKDWHQAWVFEHEICGG